MAKVNTKVLEVISAQAVAESLLALEVELAELKARRQGGEELPGQDAHRMVQIGSWMEILKAKKRFFAAVGVTPETINSGASEKQIAFALMKATKGTGFSSYGYEEICELIEGATDDQKRKIRSAIADRAHCAKFWIDVMTDSSKLADFIYKAAV